MDGCNNVHVTYVNGDEEWYDSGTGKLSRSGDLPASVTEDCVTYYKDGVCHRAPCDRPAILFPKSGDRYHYTHGIKHNEHGPAVVHYDDNGIEIYKAYYINGTKISVETANNLSKQRLLYGMWSEDAAPGPNLYQWIPIEMLGLTLDMLSKTPE